MKYSDLEVFQTSHYSWDHPHRVSLSVQFKSKAERDKFIRAVRKFLDESL